jgi:hypothetical protein
MKTHYPKARAASLWALLFTVILICSVNVVAQTFPTTSPAPPKQAPSLEKKFFVNILRDQRAIWTSPFHLHNSDSKWLAPVGLSTIALIATDRRTSGGLVEHGDNLNRLRISRYISQLGSTYSTAGVAGRG